MKINKPSKATKIVSEESGIRVSHHQSVKLSHNYQTVEVGYGVTLCARCEEEIDIKATKADMIVTRLMNPKVKESIKFLQSLDGL